MSAAALAASVARRVTVLSTPGCPNLARVQADLAAALAELGLVVQVEEKVGDYASPTVLVDDRDVVTGEYVGAGGMAVAGCRLERPSLAQLRAALR